jgi:hypothetical protein
MTSPLLLSDAQRVIGRCWSQEQPPEQARLLGFTRDALDFISATGQWYALVDFRARGAARDSHVLGEEGSPELRGLKRRAEDFFGKRLEDPGAAGEQVAIQLILDALRFISSTRQLDALGDFIEHVEAKAPPFVIASFETEAEAHDWLANHPSPPVFADILIGGRYHDVVYERETGFRRLPWNRDLERYLSWLKRVEPPVAAASFATRQEAEAWLANQPRPARRTWVTIAGDPYLAAFHPNINHRVLYPLSMAEDDKQETEDS